jgi:hypothetical protein
MNGDVQLHRGCLTMVHVRCDSRPSLNGSDVPVVFISPPGEYSYLSSASKEVAAAKILTLQDDLPTTC